MLVERENLPTENYSDHGCLALMDLVIAASNARKVGVPRVSMYDVREYELGRQFPPGHATVEVKQQELEQVSVFVSRRWWSWSCRPRKRPLARCFLAAGRVCVSRALLRRIEKARPVAMVRLRTQRRTNPAPLQSPDALRSTSTTAAQPVIMQTTVRFHLSTFWRRVFFCVCQAYLNREDVRAAIHASSCPIKFQECTDQPFVHLSK